MSTTHVTGAGPLVSCYHGHKPLDVGDGRVIYGGSCLSPSVKDADVYVGLDYGMQFKSPNWPWKKKSAIEEVQFRIMDQSVPPAYAVPDFHELIKWISGKLDEGKKVHVGCIGGHGRTGMVFAALVALRKASDDPIAYVRENYCDKAVESKAQVKFLVEEFGCKTAAVHARAATNFADDFTDYGGKKSKAQKYFDFLPGKKGKKKEFDVDSGSPVTSAGCIWTEKVTTK